MRDRNLAHRHMDVSDWEPRYHTPEERRDANAYLQEVRRKNEEDGLRVTAGTYYNRPDLQVTYGPQISGEQSSDPCNECGRTGADLFRDPGDGEVYCAHCWVAYYASAPDDRTRVPHVPEDPEDRLSKGEYVREPNRFHDPGPRSDDLDNQDSYYMRDPMENTIYIHPRRFGTRFGHKRPQERRVMSTHGSMPDYCGFCYRATQIKSLKDLAAEQSFKDINDRVVNAISSIEYEEIDLLEDVSSAVWEAINTAVQSALTQLTDITGVQFRSSFISLISDEIATFYKRRTYDFTVEAINNIFYNWGNIHDHIFTTTSFRLDENLLRISKSKRRREYQFNLLDCLILHSMGDALSQSVLSMYYQYYQTDLETVQQILKLIFI